VPENDTPDVSLKKALKSLSDAQKYLLRAGHAEMMADVMSVKEKVAALRGQPQMDHRCDPCREGWHQSCAREDCGCQNQVHRPNQLRPIYSEQPNVKCAACGEERA
jgi:hypothetical protein